jgi:hypothetical protein
MVIEVADAGTHGSELDFSLGAPAADLVGDLDAAIGCAPDVMQAIGESQLLIRTVSRDGLAPSIDETGSTMSDEERKTELERFRNENSALKKGCTIRRPHEGQRKGSSLDLRNGAHSRDLV